MTRITSGTSAASTPDQRGAHLSHIEGRLLLVLRQARGDLVTYGELLERVWAIGYTGPAEAHLVRVTISRLRRKLGPAVRIATCAGDGYRLVGL